MYILIFSISQDESTTSVVSWLAAFGENVIRINRDEISDLDISLVLTNDDCKFKIDGKWISLSEISAVWYRKCYWFRKAPSAPPFPGEVALTTHIKQRLNADNHVAAEFFHHLIRRRGIRTLGNPFLRNPNKLVVLNEAERLGFKVPNLYVLDELLPEHYDSPSKFITKAISDGVYAWDQVHLGRGYFSYTEDLADVVITAPVGEKFPISLVQEKIQKKFEVRAFYLDGAVAAVAIFSQGDAQTSTDYRKYNVDRPNRNVPIRLPTEVTERLKALFEVLSLNTGSVDMIVDQNDDYVFLEINPFGIYAGVAQICNYPIDECIARWLRGERDWNLIAKASGDNQDATHQRLS